MNLNQGTLVSLENLILDELFQTGINTWGLGRVLFFLATFHQL